jgi:hypothetical protein
VTSFVFWQRWLLVLGGIVIAFGLGMALLNATPLFDLFNRQIDPAFWGVQPLPGQALAFRGWAYGVLGATTAGWGVFIAFLAQVPFRRRERWAWNCVALGILVWYVPDTLISLSFGVLFNAFFNTLLLALVLLPLIFTRKDFEPATSQNVG